MNASAAALFVIALVVLWLALWPRRRRPPEPPPALPPPRYRPPARLWTRDR